MERMKIVMIALLLWLATASFTFAAQTSVNQSDFSYYLHLYYDNGNLDFNRDVKLKYEVVMDTFVPQQITIPNPYTGELISVSGVSLAKFSFDPTNGNPSFKQGILEVKAPYYNNAKIINLYDGQHRIMISLDVSGTLACNENKVCEENLGENFANCPVDCKASPTAIAPIASVIPSFSTIPSSGGSSDWLMIALIVVSGFAVAGLVVWFIISNRRKKAHDISVTLP